MKKSVDTSENLNQLLAALMDVSRLDSGEVTINIKPVDLNQLINSLVQEFQPKAQHQNIQFLVSFTQSYILSDPLLLMRCIRNLIYNAFDHAKATRIEILICDINEEQVQLSIIDDGIGINFEEKERIFSEFYQLKNPERDRNKGLGLGLAIVKKLSEILDHPLALETSPNNGCKFTITLQRSSLLPNIESEDINTDDISGLFIAMVDDDPLICEAMAMTMKHWGCEVLIHRTTQALINELKALDYSVPDIIIADYRLKHNQTGAQAVEQIRQYFSQQIPAIIVSGDVTESITDSLNQLHCEFHQKPVSPEKLKRSIAKLVH
jgi:CheY-like chemotaxis protein/anti-sigma regulatory factor (Ser/Thr protein kinase)